jgi:hypothetical protein
METEKHPLCLAATSYAFAAEAVAYLAEHIIVDAAGHLYWISSPDRTAVPANPKTLPVELARAVRDDLAMIDLAPTGALIRKMIDSYRHNAIPDIVLPPDAAVPEGVNPDEVWRIAPVADPPAARSDDDIFRFLGPVLQAPLPELDPSPDEDAEEVEALIHRLRTVSDAPLPPPPSQEPGIDG